MTCHFNSPFDLYSDNVILIYWRHIDTPSVTFDIHPHKERERGASNIHCNVISILIYMCRRCIVIAHAGSSGYEHLHVPVYVYKKPYFSWRLCRRIRLNFPCTNLCIQLCLRFMANYEFRSCDFTLVNVLPSRLATSTILTYPLWILRDMAMCYTCTICDVDCIDSTYNDCFIWNS